jgi:hypothetical protein
MIVKIWSKGLPIIMRPKKKQREERIVWLQWLRPIFLFCYGR